MKFEFCLPTRANIVPAGADWFHEVKYDGYRLRIERDGKAVRLITMGGNDYSKRYPLIVEAALRNRSKQFVIDGEAVVLGVDGISDFNALHASRQNDQVQLCAFDVLAIDGEDVRGLPLSMRKANLDRLLRGWPDGIFVNPAKKAAGDEPAAGGLEPRDALGKRKAAAELTGDGYLLDDCASEPAA